MEDFKNSHHPLFERWKALKARKVLCPEWHANFREFLGGVGMPPEGHKKLRRLDDARPYEVGNVEWAKTPTREDKLAYYKAWNKANPEARRAKHLADKYKITLSDYDRMYAEQNGRCAVCQREEVRPDNQRRGLKRLLAVDHDHDTGEVRALLCGDCNVGIGHFDHDPVRLFTAIQYLAKWGKVAKVS